jgi:hypothetical protein
VKEAFGGKVLSTEFKNWYPLNARPSVLILVFEVETSRLVVFFFFFFFPNAIVFFYFHIQIGSFLSLGT